MDSAPDPSLGIPYVEASLRDVIEVTCREALIGFIDEATIRGNLPSVLEHAEEGRSRETVEPPETSRWKPLRDVDIQPEPKISGASLSQEMGVEEMNAELAPRLTVERSSS